MRLFAEEMILIDELLEQIAKQGTCEYGPSNVQKAVAAGAVSKLLLTDKYILKKRSEGFEDTEKMMKVTESMKGSVHIISSEHEGGKKLDGLGGVAALLRYKLY